jgi:YidC/Oxa1 family membrane protein insertase
MTLPDLEALWLKRSLQPVQYVYLFHSTNSTHTSYREDAFDAYDTVLCVGPHHVEEIRCAERVRNLRAKTLVEHGSVKLDSVLARVPAFGSEVRPGEEPRVLIAPTWGESSLIERAVGPSVLESLIAADIDTTLRLHPMTVRRKPELIADLRQRFVREPLFRIESDMNVETSWLSSDAMITDWSGAGVEYALSLARPVFFVDTPQKIRNPNWKRVGLPPFEAQVRSKIGEVVQESGVEDLPDLIRRRIRDAAERGAIVRTVREASIFNVGRSARVAADYLASL